MRKTIILVIGSLLCANSFVCANQIDALKTDQQVNAFLHSTSVGLSGYNIKPLKSLYADTNSPKIAEQFGVKPWSKADMNNDGTTDLVVFAPLTGRMFGELFVIVQSGTAYKMAMFERKQFYGAIYPVVQKTKGRDCVVILRECENCIYKYEHGTRVENGDTMVYESFTKPWLSDTLVYGFGGLIEPNFDVVEHTVESIAYSTEMCFGECPIYSISIDSSLHITYDAMQFNARYGKSSAEMKRPEYDSLVALLNYLDFPDLGENYSVDWTDDTGCTLIITYDGGKTKKIHDYGKLGTNGLILLYHGFSMLHAELDSK